MNLKKLNKFILFSFMLMLLNPIDILANDKINTDNIEINIAKAKFYSVEPRAEETGYKYMEINGVMYRRLWSYTRNCWIDDKWQPCP